MGGMGTGPGGGGPHLPARGVSIHLVTSLGSNPSSASYSNVTVASTSVTHTVAPHDIP